ncbi:MAG: hypothetical protein AAFR37_14725, partial [Cyanobacteria bacterium J06628_3]
VDTLLEIKGQEQDKKPCYIEPNELSSLESERIIMIAKEMAEAIRSYYEISRKRKFQGKFIIRLRFNDK